MTDSGGIQQKLHKGGALRRYRTTVTGDQGLARFLLYEFSAFFVSVLPGRTGCAGRRLFMPLLFDRFGKGVTMGSNITFRRPHRISIGRGVVLEEGVTLDVKTEAGYVKIEDNVRIGRDTIVSCPGGTVIIAHSARIGSRCRLGSLQGLKIGSHAVIDDNVCIVGAGHDYSSRELPIIRQPLTCRGQTVIEENVSIEQEVTVLDGVHIGERAQVLSNSLVNRDVAAGSKVGGVPVFSC